MGNETGVSWQSVFGVWKSPGVGASHMARQGSAFIQIRSAHRKPEKLASRCRKFSRSCQCTHACSKSCVALSAEGLSVGPQVQLEEV